MLREMGFVAANARLVKVVKSGNLTKSVKLIGIAVTAGARLAIESAGGSIE